MKHGDLPLCHPFGLEDILARKRGVWGFLCCMLRVLRNAHALESLESSTVVLQGRILRWMNPAFLLIQIGVGVLAGLCLWPFTSSLILILFFIYGCLLLAMQIMLYSFSEERLTIAPCSHIIRCISVLIAFFWVVVFDQFVPLYSTAGQVFICVSSMALMASGGVLAPVSGGGSLLASIIGGGTLWVMYRAYGLCEYNLFYLASILVSASYLIFGVMTSAIIRTLFIDYLINRDFLKQRNNILSLLLGDPADTLGDWLWETDVEGRLSYVSPVFAKAMAQTVSELQNSSLISVLAHRGCNAADDCGQGALGHLSECLEHRIFFRDLVICVLMGKKRHFWSLSGRPIFQNQVFKGYRGVGTDVTEEHYAQKTAFFRARHDSLTGLPNRAAFFDDMARYLLQAERNDESFAVFNLDLDGFKEVNDRYGHHFGDEMLTKVAVMMSRTLGDTHSLYRMGGDEFVLIEKRATERSAGVTASLLVEALSTQPVLLRDGVHCNLGLSIGIVLAKGGKEDVEALLAASDLALYESKKSGGGCYHFHDARLESLVRRNRILIRDLAYALEDGSISVVYQPFLDAQSQCLLGFEALVCWRHAQYGRIMPEQIIFLAEEAALIHQLGLYVLERAARFACVWPPDLILSINVSVGQLSVESFVSDCLTTLQKTGLAPERLQMEVTETIFMKKNGATSAKLHNLRERGISIALDDFGKGFSCLSYLHFFPFSKIKLDRLFVQDMLHEPRAASIVKAVISLSVDLGVAVTAEGVETLEQFEQLVRLGCTEVQGYLFARPLKPDVAMALMLGGRSGECEMALG